jgi:hypothetical protein
MKKIITALVLMAMTHFSAEAQTCKTKSVTKHASHTQKQKTLAQSSNTLGIQGQQTIVESCHMVPYEVCKINPDRRSVSCNKTVDPYGEQPLYYDRAMTYGPTGEMPGDTTRPVAGTIIINAPAPADYCKRNEANNATICYTSGDVTRDDLGFYHYNFK